MELKTITRKWGSSLAIIIPKNVADIKKIRENEEITIEIKDSPTTGDLFGKFPGWKSKKSAQELKDEMRKGWA
jgi:antitoxin component of MazEF toxin-antitoxin module